MNFQVPLKIRDIPSNTNPHMLVLPYKEKKGEHTLSNIKREINKLLPVDRNVQVVYIGTNSGSWSNIRDKTIKENQYGLMYSVECSLDACPHTCNGQTGTTLNEKDNEHSDKDFNSYMLKHYIEQISLLCY